MPETRKVHLKLLNFVGSDHFMEVDVSTEWEEVQGKNSRREPNERILIWCFLREC